MKPATNRRATQWVAVLFCAAILQGCALMNRQSGPNLDKAVPPLVTKLVEQLDTFENPQSIGDKLTKLVKKGETTVEPSEPVEPRLLVLQPLIDSNSHEVVVASQEIEDLLIREFGKYPQYTLQKINSTNVAEADYILTGILGLEDYRYLIQLANSKPEKKYHIKLSVIDRDLSQIAAHSDIWLQEGADLNYEPIVENVFYNLEDRNDKAQIHVTNQRVGETVDLQYLDSAQVKALLAEARDEYYRGNYSRSTDLYRKVADSDNGQLIKAWTGLYRNYVKRGQMASAESAFSHLLKLSVEQDRLSVRLLFQVGNTSLNTKLSREYRMWMRQIGDYFDAKQSCLRIVGHASCTGEQRYNQYLSEQRADRIRSELSSAHPRLRNRLFVEGRGFSEALVCSGTDDEQDAVDRRVDFVLEQCNAI